MEKVALCAVNGIRYQNMAEKDGVSRISVTDTGNSADTLSDSKDIGNIPYIVVNI